MFGNVIAAVKNAIVGWARNDVLTAAGDATAIAAARPHGPWGARNAVNAASFVASAVNPRPSK